MSSINFNRVHTKSGGGKPLEAYSEIVPEVAVNEAENILQDNECWPSRTQLGQHIRKLQVRRGLPAILEAAALSRKRQVSTRKTGSNYADPGDFMRTYFPNWLRVQCQGLTVDIAVR